MVVEGRFLGAAWFGGMFFVALGCPGLMEALWLLDKILDGQTTQNPTLTSLYLPSEEGTSD